MSPRNKEVNQRIRDGRKDQILKAALHLFARQGFEATRIGEIAALAGVSYGLVDHYFGKKEEIYTAVLENAFQGAIKMLEDGVALPGSAWERLQAICTEMLEGIQEDPEYVLLVNQVSASVAIPQETKNLFREYEKQSIDLQVEFIHAGQREGQIAAGDALTLQTAFTALIQGLAVEYFISRSRGETPAYFPDVEMVLRIMKS